MPPLAIPLIQHPSKMKLHTSKQSSQILTGVIAAAASFVLASSGSAQTNGVSAFPMNIDGSFSNGPGVGEWSDVTPSFFFSAPNVTANPLPGSAGANTALYAALGTSLGEPPGSDPRLHLLYDFLPRTNQFVAPGELVASVTFPVTLPNQQTGEKTNISVLFVGAVPRPQGGAAGGGSFFDIFADLDLDGIGDVPAASLGLVGAAGFGHSPLGAFDHLIVELGVGLRIQPGFGTPGGPLPGGGINPATGLYDPDPAFWGAAGGGDGTLAGPGGAAGNLQSASTASFQIMPNGSTVVTPVLVPEPTSAVLLLAGLSAFAGRRRRS
jgi:hypothetical protein